MNQVCEILDISEELFSLVQVPQGFFKWLTVLAFYRAEGEGSI